MESTVTIPLHKYESFKKLEEGLKKREVIGRHQFLGTCIYFIPEKTCADILLEKIKELEKEIDKLKEDNKKHLDSQYDLLKEKVKQPKKKWWKY